MGGERATGGSASVAVRVFSTGGGVIKKDIGYNAELWARKLGFKISELA